MQERKDRTRDQLHNLPSAKDDQQVGSNGSDDGLVGRERALAADPCSELNGRGGQVEASPCGRDERIERSWPGGPSGKRGHGGLLRVLGGFERLKNVRVCTASARQV